MNITGGKFRGRKITAPDETFTRPTLSKTRESVFNILFSITDFENKNFLDLFAGSGIMGLEALSRGFKDCWCVEKNFKIAQVLKSNYASLGLKPNLKIGDSLKFLKVTEQKFDVIYIDPPYLSGLYENCLKIIKDNQVLQPNGIIILEHSQPVDFTEFNVIKQKIYSQKYVTFLVE
ncbi:16S rRNA (guanine(966)-N(2))-methyltransferase RsmD [bacterium]|nr:16S rRNA (guanine(966)-N(2))-methyltransferase RsmD [bacterium]